MVTLLIVFGLAMFALGAYFGWILFGDHLDERGKYRLGEGDERSGWVHDGNLFIPAQRGG